jgi:hypothetical protein
MTFFAAPPHFFTAVRCDPPRGYFAIFILVPFFGKFRIDCFQVIDTSDRISSGAVRTSIAIYGSMAHLSLPFMALFADPPYFR